MKKIPNLLLVITLLLLAIPSTAAQSTPDSFPNSSPQDGPLEFEFQEQEPEQDEIDGDPFTEDIEPEIIDNQDLRAEFVQYTQDPGNKNVKFEIVLTSNINSDRVLLEWSVGGVSVPIEGQALRGTLSVREGQTLIIPLTIRPTAYGLSEVFARIEVTNIDNQSLVTVRKNFASNEKGEILPISDEYRQQQTERTILNIILFSIGLVVLIVGGFFGLKIFIKWYDKEEAL